jgi:hypothetical protein
MIKQSEKVDTLDNVLIPVAIALKTDKPSVSGAVNPLWHVEHSKSIGGGVGTKSHVEHRIGEVSLQFTDYQLARMTATIDAEIQVPFGNALDPSKPLYIHSYTPRSEEEYRAMMDQKNAWFGNGSDPADALGKDAVWYCMMQVRAFAFAPKN